MLLWMPEVAMARSNDSLVACNRILLESQALEQSKVVLWTNSSLEPFPEPVSGFFYMIKRNENISELFFHSHECVYSFEGCGWHFDG